MDIGMPELLIVLVIVVLVVGVGRVGKIGGELGSAIHAFRKNLQGDAAALKTSEETPTEEPKPTV